MVVSIKLVSIENFMLELDIKFNTPPLLNDRNKKQNNKNKMSNLMKIETSFVEGVKMKNY